uniref:ATP binding protein n=1 Tax=Solanum tuberosum TaxID=4113 RepID=M1C283_SOLTU
MTFLNSITTTITIIGGILGLLASINNNRALFSKLKKFFSNKVTWVIDEYIILEHDEKVKNEVYEAVEIYLCNNLSPQKCKVKVSKTEKEKKNSFKVTLEHNEKVKDVYNGHKFKWIWLEFKCLHHPDNLNSIHRSEMKSFNLIYREKDYQYVFDTYLPHILNEAKYQKHI